MRDLPEQVELNLPSVNWTVKLHTSVVTTLMTIHSMEGVIIESKPGVGGLALRTAVVCAFIKPYLVKIGFYKNI